MCASHLPYHDAGTAERRLDRLRYSVRYYNHYLTDQEHVVRMGTYMREEFFDELERIGVYWRRGDDGLACAGAVRSARHADHRLPRCGRPADHRQSGTIGRACRPARQR